MTRLPRAVMFPLALAAAACSGQPHASGEPAALRVAPPGGNDGAAHGRMGVHGMVMFGEKSLFLSHIPMFHAPHDQQLIVEAAVDPGSTGVPASFSDGLYTFAPQPFSLDDLRTGALKQIRGDIHAGNFEDGGRKIAGGVALSIVRVVFARGLHDADPQPARLGYLALGSGDDAYVIHRIAGAPSFDQLARARFDGAAPSDDALAQGVPLTVEIPDTPERRLAGGKAFDAKGPQGVTQVTLVRELSCLVGPDFTSACP